MVNLLILKTNSMEQFKRAQVVMLPTKVSDIYKDKYNKLWYYASPTLETSIAQHLYIISDDEIKKGDWCIDFKDNFIFQMKVIPLFLKESKIKKIIATTDTSLTTLFIPKGFKSGVGALSHSKQIILPQPSQQFIEKYIESYNKGEVINDVLVEYEILKDKFTSYDTCKLCYFEPKLKVNPKDNTITIKKLKDSWNREERNEDIHKVINHLLYTLRIKNQNKISLGLLHELYTYSSNELNEWIEKNL